MTMTAHAATQKPRRTRLTGAQREVQILDVAEHLFIERGFDGVTIEDIARAAGVTRPVVYQHHKSKDQVFISCVRRAREQFEESLNRVLTADVAQAWSQHGDWSTAIAAGGDVYFQLIENDPGRWNLLFITSANLDGNLADELTALRAGTISALAIMMRRYAPHLPEGTLTAGAYIVSGIGEQLGRWWLTSPDTNRSEVLAFYTTAVEGALRGIATTNLSN